MSTNVLKWVVIGLTVIAIIGGIVYMESTDQTNVSPVADLVEVPVETENTASQSAEQKPTETQSESQTAEPIQQISIQPMKPKTYTTPPAMTIDTKKTYTVTLTTSEGPMKIKLFAEEAPITVNNFVFLAREGFYTGTVFHRIMSGFMIQGGDPTGTGMGSPGYRFNDETVTREYIRGTIAMANSGPNTNGSQFFIMHADYALPKQYIIFGSIDPVDTESLKTLDALAATPVVDGGGGEKSKPITPPSILSVVVEQR